MYLRKARQCSYVIEIRSADNREGSWKAETERKRVRKDPQTPLCPMIKLASPAGTQMGRFMRFLIDMP